MPNPNPTKEKLGIVVKKVYTGSGDQPTITIVADNGNRFSTWNKNLSLPVEGSKLMIEDALKGKLWKNNKGVEIQNYTFTKFTLISPTSGQAIGGSGTPAGPIRRGQHTAAPSAPNIPLPKPLTDQEIDHGIEEARSYIARFFGIKEDQVDANNQLVALRFKVKMDQQSQRFWLELHKAEVRAKQENARRWGKGE